MEGARAGRLGQGLGGAAPGVAAVVARAVRALGGGCECTA